MNNKKRAFTLGEVLVTLMIVGVIAALIIPIIKNAQPDKQKLMFKKAYTNVERVVTELVNDDDLYPDVGDYMGLDNTNAVTVNDISYSGNTKFCQLFAMTINVVDDENINCLATPGGNGTYNEPSFITADSVAYYLPSTSFDANATITVDTNGDKEPNCFYNATSCKKPDMFEILVGPDGKVGVEGDLEKEYLQDTSVIRSNSEEN